jgi:CxxC motif-containing protein (DUF1111 family)
MSGPELRGEHVQALSSWIGKVPGYKPVVSDVAGGAGGRTLFEDPAVGCASCHGGKDMTTHALVDVGTGATFKVPSLRGVGFRAPFMHDGCAASLANRFGACGGTGDKHGHIAALGDPDRAALIAFLDTL